MTPASAPEPAASRGARRLRLPDGLGEALWLWLVLRLGLGLLGVFFWAQLQIATPCHFELAMNGWGTPPPLAEEGAAFPLVGVWQRWDACWYTKIAAYGYEPGTDSANFWPLTPLAIGVVSIPLGGNVALGGLVMAGIAYVLAITGLFRLVKHDFDEPLARRTVLFISVAPAAFFLFAPFTEAPFLAAAVWAIYGARTRHWGIAALAAFVAGLTRIQGIFLVLPLAWEAWCAWRERSMATAGAALVGEAADGPEPVEPAVELDGALSEPLPEPTPAGPTRRRVPALASIVAVVAPLVAFGSFLAFTSAWMGTTPLQTQAIWGGNSFHPTWEVIDAALRWIIEKRDGLQALNLAALLLFIVAVIAGVKALPLSYSLFAIPQVTLIAIRIQPTPLTSTTRLLEVVFPAFVVFAIWMDGRRREVTWTVISTMTLAALVWLFAKGDWVA